MDQRTVWLISVIVISAIGIISLVAGFVASIVLMKCTKPGVHEKIIRRVAAEQEAAGEEYSDGEIEEVYQEALWVFASIQKWGMFVAALAVLALVIISVIASSQGII